MPPVAAAFGAVAAGTATAAAVATVVSTVGVGLSVVGKITGSKTLMKIGGVMGLVGGVTSLASGAMGAANAATAAEGVVGAAEGGMGLGGAGGALGQAGDYGMGALASEGATAGLGETIGAATEGLDAISNGAAEITQPSFNDVRFESQNTGLLNAPNNAAMPGQADYSSATKLAADAIPSGGASGATQAAPQDTSPGGIKEWWKNLSQKEKSAYIQAGTGALGGLFQGWSAEQKMAFEREKHNLMVQNANAQPVVKFKPVQNTGLLNAARSM